MYASIKFHKLIKKLTFTVTFFSVLAFLSISPAAASVNSWEFSPQEPVSGDILSIEGTASPDENVDAFVTFEKTVPVSGGNFEYVLEDVKIPNGLDNRFTVEASGAEKLNVRVKMVVWVTKSSDASGGTATVSQSSVPAGTYRIKIDGDASEGVSKVNLKITAYQVIEANSDGKFTYSYSTKSMPSGDFDIKIGGISKTVNIKSEDNSDSSSESTSTDSSSKGSTSSGSSTIDSSSEKSPSSSSTSTNSPTAGSEASTTSGSSKPTNEGSNVSNSDTNSAGSSNQTKLSGKTTPASESPSGSIDKLYLLAGMGAGLLILILYSRRK